MLLNKSEFITSRATTFFYSFLHVFCLRVFLWKLATLFLLPNLIYFEELSPGGNLHVTVYVHVRLSEDMVDLKRCHLLILGDRYCSHQDYLHMNTGVHVCTLVPCHMWVSADVALNIYIP